MKYCCDMMRKRVEHKCEKHPDPFDCPDNLVYFSRKLNKCGIIVHDGGTSFIAIRFCPWCGARLLKARERTC